MHDMNKGTIILELIVHKTHDTLYGKKKNLVHQNNLCMNGLGFSMLTLLATKFEKKKKEKKKRKN